jgi:hypothetical protein
VPRHRTAFDGVDPDEVALDRGRGGLQAREHDRDADEGDGGDHTVNDALLALFLSDVGARNIH